MLSLGLGMSDLLLKSYQNSGSLNMINVLNYGSSSQGDHALQLTDETELTLPNDGLVEMQDAETGEVVLVDTASRAVRDAFAAEAARRQALLTTRLRRLGVDQLALAAGRDFVHDLSAFLKRRTQRR
jgi:uncharacterized protein (DUF58 family)